MTYPASSAIPAGCCPITAKHWLPKTATAAIPVAGIIMGVFLEGRIRKETSVTDSLPSQAESLRHQNHYKIAIIVNALGCMAAAITCVALGIFLPFGGIGLALLFGGFAALGSSLLHRDISHVRDLENGINPWGD